MTRFTVSFLKDGKTDIECDFVQDRRTFIKREFPDFQPQVLSQITVHSHTGRVYKLQVKKSRMTSLDADLRIRNRNMVPSCILQKFTLDREPFSLLQMFVYRLGQRSLKLKGL